MLIPNIFELFPNYKPQKGVLHVGAHKCEEEPLYHSLGMNDNNILWIEANEDLKNNKKNFVQAVISDTDDEIVDFMITNNLESSSILNFKTHAYEHPQVKEVSRRKLKTTTLNTLFAKNNIRYDTFDFINIDIQGAELKALKGASKILPHIRCIYAEVNEKELYENCAFVHEIDQFLSQYAFKRVHTVMTGAGWGDAFYIK
jgi:FkbM family methyltransferase